MTLNLIVLFSIFFIKKGLCNFSCLWFKWRKYIFFCDDFFLIQINMKENLFGRCVRKGKLSWVDLHENSVFLFRFSLQLIRFFIDFIFVSNDKMLTFFSVPVSINIGDKDKLSSLWVINTVPFFNKKFSVIMIVLHWLKDIINLNVQKFYKMKLLDLIFINYFL